MDFEFSDKVHHLRKELLDFMDEHIYPAEAIYKEQLESGSTRWQIPPVMDELKAKARAKGLWNLFLPDDEHGAGLSNLEYAPLCEIMGRSGIAPEAFNCSAPDTGNMEVHGALRLSKSSRSSGCSRFSTARSAPRSR